MKTIIDTLRDPEVFGPHLKGTTWTVWSTFLCTLFALPMTDEQLAIYRKHTGRNTPPTTPFCEAWLVHRQKRWKKSSSSP